MPNKPLQTFKVVKFKKGRDCMRCGISKAEAKKFSVGCNVYGTSYEKHIYK